MTYRELQARLAKMNNDALDLDVTVYDGDNNEFHPVSCFETDWKEDADNVADMILDKGHPYFIF